MASEFLQQFAAGLLKEVQVGSADDGMPADPVTLAVANPKVRAILEALHKHPLLVEPTARFLDRKIAEVSMATLQALYSPAELDELKKQAGLA
mgnify:CR=1 FL=1